MSNKRVINANSHILNNNINENKLNENEFNTKNNSNFDEKKQFSYAQTDFYKHNSYINSVINLIFSMKKYSDYLLQFIHVSEADFKNKLIFLIIESIANYQNSKGNISRNLLSVELSSIFHYRRKFIQNLQDDPVDVYFALINSIHSLCVNSSLHDISDKFCKELAKEFKVLENDNSQNQACISHQLCFIKANKIEKCTCGLSTNKSFGNNFYVIDYPISKVLYLCLDRNKTFFNLNEEKQETIGSFKKIIYFYFKNSANLNNIYNNVEEIKKYFQNEMNINNDSAIKSNHLINNSVRKLKLIYETEFLYQFKGLLFDFIGIPFIGENYNCHNQCNVIDIDLDKDINNKINENNKNTKSNTNNLTFEKETKFTDEDGFIIHHLLNKQYNIENNPNYLSVNLHDNYIFINERDLSYNIIKLLILLPFKLKSNSNFKINDNKNYKLVSFICRSLNNYFSTIVLNYTEDQITFTYINEEINLSFDSLYKLTNILLKFNEMPILLVYEILDFDNNLEKCKNFPINDNFSFSKTDIYNLLNIIKSKDTFIFMLQNKFKPEEDYDPTKSYNGIKNNINLINNNRETKEINVDHLVEKENIELVIDSKSDDIKTTEPQFIHKKTTSKGQISRQANNMNFFIYENNINDRLIMTADNKLNNICNFTNSIDSGILKNNLTTSLDYIPETPTNNTTTNKFKRKKNETANKSDINENNHLFLTKKKEFQELIDSDNNLVKSDLNLNQHISNNVNEGKIDSITENKTNIIYNVNNLENKLDKHGKITQNEKDKKNNLIESITNTNSNTNSNCNNTNEYIGTKINNYNISINKAITIKLEKPLNFDNLKSKQTNHQDKSKDIDLKPKLNIKDDNNDKQKNKGVFNKISSINPFNETTNSKNLLVNNDLSKKSNILNSNTEFQINENFKNEDNFKFTFNDVKNNNDTKNPNNSNNDTKIKSKKLNKEGLNESEVGIIKSSKSGFESELLKEKLGIGNNLLEETVKLKESLTPKAVSNNMNKYSLMNSKISFKNDFFKNNMNEKVQKNLNESDKNFNSNISNKISLNEKDLISIKNVSTEKNDDLNNSKMNQTLNSVNMKIFNQSQYNQNSKAQYINEESFFQSAYEENKKITSNRSTKNDSLMFYNKFKSNIKLDKVEDSIDDRIKNDNNILSEKSIKSSNNKYFFNNQIQNSNFVKTKGIDLTNTSYNNSNITTNRLEEKSSNINNGTNQSHGIIDINTPKSYNSINRPSSKKEDFFLNKFPDNLNKKINDNKLLFKMPCICNNPSNNKNQNIFKDNICQLCGKNKYEILTINNLIDKKSPEPNFKDSKIDGLPSSPTQNKNNDKTDKSIKNISTVVDNSMKINIKSKQEEEYSLNNTSKGNNTNQNHNTNINTKNIAERKSSDLILSKETGKNNLKNSVINTSNNTNTSTICNNTNNKSKQNKEILQINHIKTGSNNITNSGVHVNNSIKSSNLNDQTNKIIYNKSKDLNNMNENTKVNNTKNIKSLSPSLKTTNKNAVTNNNQINAVINKEKKLSKDYLTGNNSTILKKNEGKDKEHDKKSEKDKKFEKNDIKIKQNLKLNQNPYSGNSSIIEEQNAKIKVGNKNEFNINMHISSVSKHNMNLNNKKL